MPGPAEWRKKAALYWEQAQSAVDFELREQLTEMAVRYLQMAEKYEDEVVSAAILNGRSRRQ